MLLSIVYFGDPRLRKKALPVEEVTEELRHLAQNMLETMDANNGIGLAATQVGSEVRLFILRNYEEMEDGSIQLTEPQVYINPKISILDDRIQEDTEGCLSLPGLRESVVRPYSIRVEALDLEGKPFTELLEGYKARVVLHENDHLNGVLFIDRIPAAERKRIAPHLQAIKKKYLPK
jgi:peptide deformylase